MDVQVLACGLLLLATALLVPRLARWPVSTAMLYLAAGTAVGPWWLGWLEVDALRDARWLETAAEVAVLVSLFVTGLKIDTGAVHRPWRLATRLATLTMLASIALIALAAHWLLQMPWAAALLLGAILAPTDPVLAADLQVRSPEDRDGLRVALTGEAGLNDGTAFPFVMLGLGLLGGHEIGPAGLRWLLVDVLWAVGAGLAVGWCVGRAVGHLIARGRQADAPGEPLSEFVVIGSIAAAYGAALVLHGYGFLAVFVAGLQMRRTWVRLPGLHDTEAVAPVLQFNGQLERILEFVLVIVVGAALAQVRWSWALAAFIVLALGVLRPVAVALTLPRRGLGVRQRWLTGWFGIRGIGTLYYLAYALHHGAGGAWAAALVSGALGTVAASIVLHGLSATPLMALHERGQRRRGP